MDSLAHWILNVTVIHENESQTRKQIRDKVQILMSKLGQFDIEEVSFYGGIGTTKLFLYRYELIVYALDTKLNLKTGIPF